MPTEEPDIRKRGPRIARDSTTRGSSALSHELLDERQAAELFVVSRRTVQGWRARCEGPPYLKLLRAVRYDGAELQDWIMRHRRKGAA